MPSVLQAASYVEGPSCTDHKRPGLDDFLLDKIGAPRYGRPTIMILLVILTQRRETESDPPRRQDRPEYLEAADVHALLLRFLASPFASQS